ncbi:hypothetical protein [Iodobacter fluviatilis]|uniref:Uncharacterized protein n=2 Tax=Pseudomonadota TaxID=1224 RepID=A0A377STI4_9NEIS|nr:hypothetical protein [Iodobacter fluviatilis]TCU84983.1 hypothetical protein EV682_1085 [Iodobacter fluviatilis]STR45334.1 Uncharacterised protein [Iodobacter fluviatilis]
MQNDSALLEFFQPGFVPLDLPPLAGLIRARPYLDAFITLFRGGEEEVMVRLLVLREIGARAQAPRWTPQDLQAHFAYINPVKLETVLKRIRDNGLLVWDSDEQLYSLSEPGRIALASIGTLVQFSDGDAELGYLTAQVAAGQSVGRVAHEALQHLLARLNELYRDFEEALESQSEFQIRKAQSKLESVWKWVEKGTEVMHAILDDDTLDLLTLNQAQAIATAQSRMLRLTSVFQRRLSELAAQRVHLGESGLTSTNVADWLRRLDQDELANLGRDLLIFHPEPVFVTADELLDISEYELVSRERLEYIESALPSSEVAEDVEAMEVERLLDAEALFEELGALAARGGTAELFEQVVADTYNVTAYRLSLLSLLGDADAALEQSVVADLVRLPLFLEAEEGVELLEHLEVAAISRGRLRPVDIK